MQIEFLGAAQTVTGSMHLVRTRHAAVLLDCGLYQGRRRESYERNRELELPVSELSAVVLSHAHIDHSGALPILARHGYRGPIWATPATRDLCAVMLRDAANIMASDARTLTRQNQRENRDDEIYPPLYDDDDVVEALERFRSVPYHQSVEIARGVQLAFYDAGHVLGSAITVLDVEEGGARRRIVFTGDLGRASRPILRDPEVPPGAEVLISESTYGDRLHDATEKMEEDLASVIDRTLRRGGKLLIPSFALERAQEVVFALKHLRARGQLPRVPVYIDSPLTIKITDAFKLHPECFDAQTRALFRSADSPFEFPELRYVETVDESKRVTASDEPAIVIAASGMCEGGRILHHLRAAVDDPANTVLIVGFQAQHTLGRRLVERRERVKIFGMERERRCEVVVLNGFSAHADQNDLLTYADRCRERGRLERIALVHGDLGPQQVLAGLLRERGHAKIAIPAPGESLSLL
jgi:metallo-beta-lactamase family protein